MSEGGMEGRRREGGKEERGREGGEREGRSNRKQESSEIEQAM